MSRSRWRVVLLSSALLGIGALAFAVGRILVAQRTGVSPDVARSFVPEVDQRIEGFHRVSVRAGGRSFELSADEARYDQGSGRVEVSAPRVVFYDEEVGEIRLTGRSGEILLDGEEIERLDLKGDVELSFRELELQVPAALFVRATDTIVAPGGVKIKGKEMELTGDSLVVNVVTHRVHIVGNVRTKLQRAGALMGGQEPAVLASPAAPVVQESAAERPVRSQPAADGESGDERDVVTSDSGQGHLPAPGASYGP